MKKFLQNDARPHLITLILMALLLGVVEGVLRLVDVTDVSTRTAFVLGLVFMAHVGPPIRKAYQGAYNLLDRKTGPTSSS